MSEIADIASDLEDLSLDLDALVEKLYALDDDEDDDDVVFAFHSVRVGVLEDFLDAIGIPVHEVEGMSVGEIEEYREAILKVRGVHV